MGAAPGGATPISFFPIFSSIFSTLKPLGFYSFCRIDWLLQMKISQFLQEVSTEVAPFVVRTIHRG